MKGGEKETGRGKGGERKGRRKRSGGREGEGKGAEEKGRRKGRERGEEGEKGVGKEDKRLSECIYFHPIMSQSDVMCVQIGSARVRRLNRAKGHDNRQPSELFLV